MMHSVDIHGLYVPGLLLLMLAAWLLNSLLCHALARIGLYRHIWHPPLFNLALYLLVLGGIHILLPGAYP